MSECDGEVYGENSGILNYILFFWALFMEGVNSSLLKVDFGSALYFCVLVHLLPL